MSTTKVYGVLNLLWDIRDGHSICKEDPSAKAILWSIASRSKRKKGFTCYPSLKLIARDVQMSERTIRDRMKLLLAEGLIQRTRRYNGSYVYCVNVDKIRTEAEKQRKVWKTEKLLKKAKLYDCEQDRAFEEIVEANKAIAAPLPATDDATFPHSTKALDHTETLTQEILDTGALSERITEDEALNLASAICQDYTGDAPVIALRSLDDKVIRRAERAHNPCGYLRTVLENELSKASAEPDTADEGDVGEENDDYYPADPVLREQVTYQSGDIADHLE